MKITFLYPDSPISPHFSHLTWAKSVCKNIVKTPIKIGFFDISKIPVSDVLLIESLYCLPYAKIYKKRINPDCKIISIIADTSFWKNKLNLFRIIYYKMYLDSIDGFIAVSERIKRDIRNYTCKPVVVVRPFPVNAFRFKKYVFNKNILFIGNKTEEKGYKYLIESMKYLPNFELLLVGDCYKGIQDILSKNIHIEGRVKKLTNYFKKCSYYVHPADFDPCPVSVWESMSAGLIPIITKDVGQSEIFSNELKKLILDNNKPITIANKLTEIDGLSNHNKLKLSKKCKRIVENYIKEKSIKAFRKSFFKLINSI